MQFTNKRGKLFWAAALLTIPSVAVAQDNVSNDVAVTDMGVANGTLADPALNDTMGSDLGTANGMDATALPTDDTLASDIALAETAPPRKTMTSHGACWDCSALLAS